MKGSKTNVSAPFGQVIAQDFFLVCNENSSCFSNFCSVVWLMVVAIVFGLRFQVTRWASVWSRSMGHSARNAPWGFWPWSFNGRFAVTSTGRCS